MYDIFDLAYCINLARRPDRWKEFLDGLPNPWPFVEIERWIAIDGNMCHHPSWWKQGGGAWGCYRSHLGIIEKCLNEGINSVLIFEDDAIFDPDFAIKALQYLDAIPDLRGMIYFGGQHLWADKHPPYRINDKAYLAYNINRTHAYAIVGRPEMMTIYQHLCTKDWKDGHHIDHHFGRLHEEYTIPIYCPAKWLVGQRGGQSNISGQKESTNFWKDADSWPSVPLAPVIAVVGAFRSGTSCVAGVLHHLGVSMGDSFEQPHEFAKRGTFEDAKLAALCRQFFKEPEMIEQRPSLLRKAALRRWLENRTRHVPRGGWIGAKHPALSLMIEDLVEAWPILKIVAVERPVEDMVASGLNTDWLAKTAENVIPMMVQRRDEALGKVNVPILRLEYYDLLDSPVETLGQLISFCEISPEDSQIQSALKIIDETLCKHRQYELVS